MIDVSALAPREVAGVCDHTFLDRPECFRAEADPLMAYDRAVEEFLDATLALDPAPYAVCVRPEEVERVVRRFLNAGRSDIKVAAVVGFPLGDQYRPGIKGDETKWVLDAGASEVDTVLRWRSLMAGREVEVTADLAAVVKAATRFDAKVKVILETCQLDEEAIAKACNLCRLAGVNFVKTSTGFGKGGATVAALRVMRANFPRGIKISGGVKADNLGELLAAALGPQVESLDPLQIRIGESSLL
ncbi:MAG: deoxyribose-phosphate aldolase [Candidatus Lernaella stagnicola]|nr:deoxyribose-phosphate aldolase [Candidatus Lernaella stagnicola]